MPAHRVGQRVVIVVGAGIAAAAIDRRRGERRAAGEQMHRLGARFERDRGCIEGRGRAADHRDVLAGERGEIDVVGRVRP